MQQSLEILKKYWSYDSFRHNQEKIINSILEKKDTLAILPTGGGKTICYQIPSLILEGICIVVSPLISLMNDQIESLKTKGIKSIAITSKMDYNEVNIALTNCIFGNFKFLYLSPERLQNEFVKKKISEMKVNLIAIDEAHCITEWGHDFRPSYRNISALRQIKPEATILALTATATEKVATDIQENLNFNSRKIIKSPLYRKNISYLVYKVEDKINKLINILKRVDESGIIYVKTRKKSETISKLLNKNKINSKYYHAGMSVIEREKVQIDWKNSKTKFLISTNAFGMGIDKPDVRLVIHFHIPDNIESYYQQNGRAGRDGKESYAILLHNEKDIIEYKKSIKTNFPNLEDLKSIYQNLANYLQLAINQGKDESYDFNLTKFCKKYKYNNVKVINSLKILENEKFLMLQNNMYRKSRVKIIVTLSELNNFQSNNVLFDSFINLLLRSYIGIFDNYVDIDERELANKKQISEKEIDYILNKLNQLEIISYIPKTSGFQIKYLQNRINQKHIKITEKTLNDIVKSNVQRMKSILEYVEQKTICRKKLILSYFDEFQEKNCDKCDVCRSQKII